MNDIFDIINTRKSTREFNEEEVNLEDVKKILKSTLNVASSRNVQPLSYIVFTDKNKISKMAEFSGNQSQVKNAPLFILIIADLSKLINALKLSNKEINEVYQNVLQEVLVDAGIAVSTIDILSQSLGYGSTIIGGIGSVNPMGAVDYLKLPKYNIPLVGITMGKNNNKNILKKPKQSFETSIFFEEYDNELATKGVLEYNENLKKILGNFKLKFT